jgi:site-specific recombinase XerD
VLDLLTGSLASTTYNNYGTGMRRFTVFCGEEGITPLVEATAADMLRFTAWLARPEPSRPTASNPTSQQSRNSFATTLRSQWRWEHF